MAATALKRALSTRQAQTLEFSDGVSDQTAKFYEARLLPQKDQRALMIIRDVSEKKAVEAEIHRLAFYDTLTGLPNRHYFLDRTEQILNGHDDGDEQFGLLFLNFDRFKRINDTLGYSAGDDALKQISGRLQQARSRLNDRRLRAEIARLGADEFVFFFATDSNLKPIDFAMQLNTLLTTPLNCDRHQVVLTPSIGIATYPTDGNTADLLLQHATRAMSSAKAAGGNTHHVYSAEEIETANDLLTLEIDLRQAIANNELRLFFQPKYELATGAMAGAEALLRWFHPTRGMVSPALFIPAAEQSGLIVDIDRWVADQVCQYLHQWQSQGLNCVPLSINLSGREFCFDQPAVTMQQALARNAVDPHLLEIEITETVLMEDIDHATETLRELKSMGIRLAVDDFGTGYSSMSYLKRFPLDVMKIDRSFIADLETDESDRAICRAMISVARGLNMEVVAEGTETDFQLQFLREAGCEIGQGFLLDRPMKIGEFIERLRSPVAHIAQSSNQDRPQRPAH
jgi:diguanylate cyclase (GGDEF)-like protein